MHVIHNHAYAAKSVNLNATGEVLKYPVVNQQLVRCFYNNHIHISATEIKDLETRTQSQVDCELWHQERRLQITASVMKEVCHRKESTNCKAFLMKKPVSKEIHTAASHYGNHH